LEELKMAEYIVIETQAYEIDTDEQRAEATAAMRDAGLAEAAVHVGDADDPSSYANGKRFTAKGEVFFG
jgi:hypothetical protein